MSGSSNARDQHVATTASTAATGRKRTRNSGKRGGGDDRGGVTGVSGASIGGFGASLNALGGGGGALPPGYEGFVRPPLPPPSRMPLDAVALCKPYPKLGSPDMQVPFITRQLSLFVIGSANPPSRALQQHQPARLPHIQDPHSIWDEFDKDTTEPVSLSPLSPSSPHCGAPNIQPTQIVQPPATHAQEQSVKQPAQPPEQIQPPQSSPEHAQVIPPQKPKLYVHKPHKRKFPVWPVANPNSAGNPQAPQSLQQQQQPPSREQVPSSGMFVKGKKAFRMATGVVVMQWPPIHHTNKPNPNHTSNNLNKPPSTHPTTKTNNNMPHAVPNTNTTPPPNDNP
ncbi:hypothetical protein Pelo_5390 [Pelomyxa schiedti]|nr:hypothetical protein Pelo_5390 [Pelomyxa schiedti]